jgi:ornithine cyclodeaminase/alanine dehydrogenase-like protein (mu-crystallin family)
VTILVIGAREVRELLPYDACADQMRQVLAALARGEVFQPLRTVLRPPGAAGLMALMPGYARDTYGLKAICITPGNPAIGKDAHQGGVLLSRGDTGEPVALVNASAVTEIRTAAVSAVATAALARPGPAVLAVIGTGVQARAHLRAMAATLDIASARVAGRDLRRARDLADQAAEETGVPVTACAAAAGAVDGADIIVTATSAAEPVLRLAWLKPGAHVNAVGACVPDAREIDTATMAAAALFADRRESMLNEAGDYVLAAREGAVRPDSIRAELGDVLAGAAPGRTEGGAGEEEITLFESLGLAAEDLAAARYVYQAALAAGAGTQAEF